MDSSNISTNALNASEPSHEQSDQLQQAQQQEQPQQQQHEHQQDNFIQMNQLFTKYDFDVNNDELQGLQGNGEDDFPLLFWDNLDDGVRGTPAAAPQVVVTNTQIQKTQTQQQQQQQQQQQPPKEEENKNANVYSNSNGGTPATANPLAMPGLNAAAQNFMSEIANQIAVNANSFQQCIYPFLPNQQQAFNGAFQQAPMMNAPNSWNPQQQGQTNSGNGNMPQHQFVNPVTILPKGNNNQAQSNGGSSNDMSGNMQQQQPLNQLFNALNPQQIPLLNSMAGFSQFHQTQQQQQQQQARNDQQQQQQNQVQNMQLLQQLQKQQPQSVMYGQGNLMLPPQQPFQVQMQSSQQQQQQQQLQSSQQQQQTQATQSSNQQQIFQSHAQQHTSQGNSAPQERPMQNKKGPISNNNDSNQSASMTATANSPLMNSTAPMQSQTTRKRQFDTMAKKSAVLDARANIVSSSETESEVPKISRLSQARSVLNASSHVNSLTSAKSSTNSIHKLSDLSSIQDLLQRPESPENKNDEQLTEEERAQANRRRNREHARNTRARKKAYLESLKTTLDELCRERDTLVSERAGAATVLLEMQKARSDVLLSFFALRSSCEKRRTVWSSILDETVTCILPVTPYRSFPSSEVQISKCQRNVIGIDGMISDAASLQVLLNSLVDRSKHPDGIIQFRYTLIAEEAVVSGNQMMSRWAMTTTNAVSLGARREVGKTGMLCARFNSSHKIMSLELMFDVMAFMLQLKQSSGSNIFTMVPNTFQTCVGPFAGNKPMVMTAAERPYNITQVNKAWEEMTAWKSEEVVGKMSCKILQGERTERVALESLMSNILYQRPLLASLTNYDKNGQLFRNFINIYPLSTDSKITHYLGVTVHCERLTPNGNRQAEPSKTGDSALEKLEDRAKDSKVDSEKVENANISTLTQSS